MLEDLQSIAFESSKSSNCQNERRDERSIFSKAKPSLTSNDEREISMRYHEKLLTTSSKNLITPKKNKKKSSNTDRIGVIENDIGLTEPILM